MDTEALSRDSDETYRSARILMNEGMIPDAKRLLVRILSRDPHYVPARKLLKEIQNAELKSVMEPEGRGRRSVAVDTEALIRDLERDLGLDCSDERAAREFALRLDHDLKDLSPRDRMDIGIAFLEIGLTEAASAEFYRGAQDAMSGSEPDEPLHIAALNLFAVTRVEAGKPHEAIQAIEPLLMREDLSAEDRVDLQYVMALAQEEFGNLGAAARWYARVVAADPQHRDARERLERLRSK